MGFKKIVLDPKADPTGFHLTQIQDNVDQALKDITNLALLKGVFVQTALVNGVDNKINTGLGRPYLGFFPVDIDQNCVVWRSQSNNPFPDKQIFLRSNVNANVKLYIF